MKSLIAYFSHRGYNRVDGKVKYLEKGNTEIVAHMIACVSNLPLFKIEPESTYPDNFYEYLDITQQELANNTYPKLKGYLHEHYDEIYLGFPNYWGTMPRAVFSFLKDLNDEHIVIHPFITHDGGDYGTSLTDIKTLCPHATITEPLSLKCTHIQCQLSAIENWVKKGSHDNG